MEDKFIEIDGDVFDLSDPEGKKGAVRAWLKVKSRERAAREAQAEPAAESDRPGEGAV
jgi:hypothetical protein